MGFRYFTKDVADREGVFGWVRNLPDGRVEAFVEGEAESVTRVERLLWQGPGGARVESLDPIEETPGGRHKGFAVVQ